MSNSAETLKNASKNHTNNSAYREKLIEHIFVAELLKLSWLHQECSLEVAKPEVDNAGYDLIAEASGYIRHIQLKTTVHGGKAANQKVHSKLAEKPSGCVIWIYFDERTLSLGPFLYFGSEAGKPLPNLLEYKIAKHTKGNKEGFRAERPKIRVIPKGEFQKFESIDVLFAQLFETELNKPEEKQSHLTSVLKKSRNVTGILPIDLFPADLDIFKDSLLRSRKAKIEITYSNGTTEVKNWNVNRFNGSSNIKGNLRSRPDFRSGKWQASGIERIAVRVNTPKD